MRKRGILGILLFCICLPLLGWCLYIIIGNWGQIALMNDPEFIYLTPVERNVIHALVTALIYFACYAIPTGMGLVASVALILGGRGPG